MDQINTNRREFLKKSACLTAAGLAVPYFWTSANAQSTESKAGKLNIAAIGVGGRGSGISHDAAKFGNMVACADVDKRASARFAGKYPGKCEIYSDYRKILERPDIDVIICGTPDHWHSKIAIETMQAGKHLYCEKPLTLTIEESKLINQTAKQFNKVFQVGTQQRSEYNEVFLKAVAIARSGRLGDKLHALSSVNTADKGGPFEEKDPPATLDWDFWLGQIPKVAYSPNRLGWNFRWWLHSSGGQVTDWGVHHNDIALWALGGEDTGVIEAKGEGEFPLFTPEHDINNAKDIIDFLNGKKTLPPYYNVAWCFDCDMLLPNGNTIHLTSGNDKTKLNDKGKNEIIISGDKGKIRVNRGQKNNGNLTGKIVETIMASETEKQWLEGEVAKLYRNMPRQGHMANFFHCIETGEKPISDVFTHLNSVNSCHMANISMMLKRKVKWDPEKYEFIDDDEANMLMHRQQREPYAIEA
jgi:myo-inositol 2-dehydrogenase / D-chiro-inositol 1-dehydrogenase